MTVGTRIQKYRKELGMSQEELGQKLLVSRQTISLWEKDQTVPTIDNIMRLKEIFAVSLDELLDGESKQSIPEIQPDETYRFQFDQKELKKIYQQERRNTFIKPIIFLAVCVFQVIFLMTTSWSSGMVGFAWGILFISVFYFINSVRKHRKLWKFSAERISQSTYEYQIYENHIIVCIYHNHEIIRQSKCYYTDIEKIQNSKNWLFIQFGGQTFIVRKADISSNSALYSYIEQHPKKTINANSKIWNIVSWILFAASLLSIFGALNLIDKMASEYEPLPETIWVCFLLTPIPVASIVFGFVLKSKGYRYTKNIIVGIIMTVILCVFGSFVFMFSYDHSDAPIIRVEQTVGIEIPEHKYINTEDWSNRIQSSLRGTVRCVSDVYFDDAAAEEFEKQLAQDKKWMASVSNTLIGITSWHTTVFTAYDYILIYNTDTSQYNSLPDENGTYHYINLFYQEESNYMRIVEYDIDYVR